MPLHLLGKKSWNVYNQENVDRVRQDETAARSAENEAERSRQREEASQRLKTLRGENHEESVTTHTASDSILVNSQNRKRTAEDAFESSYNTRRDSGYRNGQFADEEDLSKTNKSGLNARHARHREETNTVDNLDRISNMKFKDAAGKYSDSRGPWYAQNASEETDKPAQNVWGDEDLGRKARNEQRLSADDPLSAMKKGVRKLKDAERHRKEWMAQRERDLNEVEDLARRHRKNKKRRRDEDRHRITHGHETSSRKRRAENM